MVNGKFESWYIDFEYHSQFNLEKTVTHLTNRNGSQWVVDQWLLKLTVLGHPRPETAHLVEADVQCVAHRIVESHDSEFLDRAPGLYN